MTVLEVQDPAAALDAQPVLDGDGLLRYRGRWVAVSRKEERLLVPLLDRWQRVVGRDDLRTAVWGDVTTATSSLNTLLQRLRRRIEPLGLTIESLRAKGFMLQALPRPATTTTYLAARGDLSEGLSWLTS